MRTLGCDDSPFHYKQINLEAARIPRPEMTLSFVKRNRVVSIRVTQDEYQTLDRISRGRGANSVSEYLRQLIMNAAPVVSATRRVTQDVQDVSEDLDYLKREVDRLSQIVEMSYSPAERSDRHLARKAPKVGITAAGS